MRKQELSLGARRLRAVVIFLAGLALIIHFTQQGQDVDPDVSNVESQADLGYVPSVFVGPGAPISAIRRHHYAVQIIPLPTSFQEEAFRVALWDNPTVPVAVFAGPPGFTELSRKDFIAWVSSGKNVVFLGGYANIVAMNQIFGFELEYVPHQPGPYWQNVRNVPGTPFQYGPSRLREVTPFYGITLDSLPLSGYSIKYNLGTVCYVGAQFNEAYLPDPLGTVLRAAVRM